MLSLEKKEELLKKITELEVKYQKKYFEELAELLVQENLTVAESAEIMREREANFKQLLFTEHEV